MARSTSNMCVCVLAYLRITYIMFTNFCHNILKLEMLCIVQVVHEGLKIHKSGSSMRIHEVIM